MTKKAVVVVSFGTSYKEAREKAIRPCEEWIASAFKGYDFYRAFTSNRIIKKIAQVEKIHIPNPLQLLDTLVAEGYEEVVIQTLHIICGEEYCKLKEQVETYKGQFKKLALGTPLLTESDDYKEVVEAVKWQLPRLEENQGVVFMGHGTTHEAHLIYGHIEDLFQQQNLPIFIGTLEGAPGLDEVIKHITKLGIKKVYLMPFMLVAGSHVAQDMSSDGVRSWKTIFQASGFEVVCVLNSLGENPAIRACFLKHAQEAVGKG